MARMVKCKACGKQILQTDAYKHVHTTSSGKTQNHYYCSLEEYETVERDKELYRLCQYSTDEILGRPITNNARNKELMQLHEQYSWEEIYRCIKAKAEDIKNLIAYNKIEGDYQQIRYCMQVIKNTIYDFTREDAKKNDWSQYKTVEELDVYEEKEETNDDIIKRLKDKKETTNNISSFLNGLK